MKWKKRSDKIPTTIAELKQIVFENRAIPASEVNEFLNPTHPKKIQTKKLGIDRKQLQGSAKLLKKTIANDEKIVIFGDYDVDGVCASALLWQILFKLYKKQHPEGLNHPAPFIPHREKHGYGITQVAIDEIIEAHGPQLIITVDNGIVAHEPIAYAREKGIDVIITDHHQPELKADIPQLPQANFVVHSTQLCGTTVAWMLSKELDTSVGDNFLDLAGIATIADQVPLQGANRSFATFGIQALRQTTSVGINALCKSAGVIQPLISEGTIGFALAPRINAMGRLEHGLDALRLLCTKNKKQAEELAQILNETNTTRQELTKQMLATAHTQVLSQADQKIIIVHSTAFHEGILGLIAGGIQEEYHKPTIAISLGKTLAKGSARSVAGVNITDLLRQVQSDLVSVGGHPLAAGFSFLPEKIELVTQKLFSIAQKEIDSELLHKSLNIDCQIPASLLTLATVKELESFAPYGMKNAQPVFEICNLKILEVKHIGKEKEHMKLKVRADKAGAAAHSAISFDCLGWRMGHLHAQFVAGESVSIVGVIESNEWNGKQFLQVILRDIHKDVDIAQN